MSDLGNIEPPYKEGMKEKQSKNYLRAARWFRICFYYYDDGELPFYDIYLEYYGLDAIDQFEYCKSRLTDEAQGMLEMEEEEHQGDWEEFIQFNYKKMKEEANLSSPNRPYKKWTKQQWIEWRQKQQYCYKSKAALLREEIKKLENQRKCNIS